jgi:hypothetical protein
MSLKNWIIRKLGGATSERFFALREDAMRQYAAGVEHGKRLAKTHFAILPLPFTGAQLSGKDYGMFITPEGFGDTLGECSVPAPGQHGYEMRAGYIRKNGGGEAYGKELRVYGKDGNEATLVYPHVADEDREHYIPVIVVVLQ